MNPSPQFSDITLLAVNAALTGGRIISEGLSSNFIITEKGGKLDLVTEIDYKSEKAILSLIKENYPDHAILAEESGFSKNHSPHTATWIIDPLDGTTNFSRKIPLFVVSIAIYSPPSLQTAVIFEPITNELFIAEKGKGAYLNGQKLQVTKNAVLTDSIIGYGLPYSHEKEFPQGVELLTHFVRKGVTLRNLGSAALMLAYIAAGKLDGGCFSLLSPWDIAAGQLLIEEAGGRVSNFSGESFDIMKPTNLIACNCALYDALKKSVIEG